MVSKQDTNRVEDIHENLTTKDKDDKRKEPLDRPTKSLDRFEKPTKIEVDLHNSHLLTTFHSYFKTLITYTHVFYMHTVLIHKGNTI